MRERAEISRDRGKAKVVVEAALDLGHVIAGKHKKRNLRTGARTARGEPAALLELAAELAEKLALMPC